MSDVQQSTAYALIVGISKYEDESIRPLDYTHADADAVGRLLADPRRCGIPEAHTRVLIDREATLYNIKRSIGRWLHQNATEDSTVFVFFAGHGGLESDRTGMEPDGIQKYLLPWDAKHDDLFNSALSNADFQRLLNTVRARRMVIFMDACYSGGVAERGGRDLGVVGNPYERLAEGQGRLVIAASKPNQRSWEDESLGHGIFTHHLLEALSGKADTDDDGYVSIMEVYKYLERNVPASARSLARGDQVPMLIGSLASDIVLTVDADRVRAIRAGKKEQEEQRREEVRKKREALFALFNGGELPSDVFYETVQLIEKHPDALSQLDRKVLKFAELLAQAAITAQFYIETRALLIGQAGPNLDTLSGVTRSRDAASDARVNPSPAVEPPKMKYCISCGTPLNPGRSFCIGCGRKIAST